MTRLRYSCLVLDHDDTAVDSTSVIHHPAHVEVMRQLRPDVTPVDLDNWFRKNFEPGIMGYLMNELGFSEEEISEEYKVWRDYTVRIDPPFFPGFLDFLREYRRRGGLIAVVSHSETDIITRHYKMATDGSLFLPDLIHGWSTDESKRKPHPFPVWDIMEQYHLDREEILVVDDLKPGVLMAKAAGVAVAAAAWSHQIDEIQCYMKDSCDYYFQQVDEFARFILQDSLASTGD